ncbi:uroporphyrinogen III methylase [Xenorhabdus nematophila ATCC 19061]|uniref:Uroporphyrinogen III methylase n=1 Tax=Xenorhabdus nematophila (strain ATCC 19061 / DSM 3370 / CCUG 14189 / LMG 1036 / NCIMB 9965 / AN6) TaxID=406817 RepID=D3VHZ1_XENNA|nr:uroporphyrinogen-III C-methyltransferase [Xenorhabdus nematophila]CBJ88480.1 uroporphyrinogen III methylase [Xenorhabdus nematophila ATCC 19061]CEK21395.1 uroporphyrinogen III methylase [Xenorhabdus nematophila AN6/1]
MTEQKQSTDAVETKHPQQPEKAPHNPQKNGWVGHTLSIAISLAIGMGGFYIYYHSKQQNAVLSTENATLQQQFTSLVQQQSANQQSFDSKLQELETSLQQAKSQNQQLDDRMAALQDRVAAISNTNIENWRLAQASSLVKIAGRKIWSEQDIPTAIALLEDADQNLAEMDDPSLLYARNAIRSDIDTLTKIKQIDLDGIILSLNQLSNQVDHLRLADDVAKNTSKADNKREITSSLTDWRENLTTSWHSFMDNFITITPRDGSKEPLLAPNQNIYLRENIRAKLLIAAQAAPRHQNKIYKDALDHVGEWAKSYFDTANPDTKAFLDNVNSLAKRPLSIDVPEQLSSQPILADLVRKRIYNLPHSAPSQKKSEDNPQNKPEISSQPTTIEESGQAKIAVEES